MKLENQVVSLELSKQLKEAGYKQESLFYWSIDPDDGEDMLVYSPSHYQHNIRKSAPTVAELGEALPKTVEDYIDGRLIQFNIEIIRPTDCLAPQWDIVYISPNRNDVLAEVGDDTEADARAKMWLYLKKEGLL